MATPSIADIGNHIMNLIGRTISSLALPDKKKGSCSVRMEENSRGSSSKHDVETSLLSLNDIINGGHEFNGRSRYP
ncbi:unnamed protein product [Lasius platythorax]|uniref:Uncharacterized protein n=1 Tax=Lasius platythorax TaxID=488582 RepID=A0AAV2P671_9HYME